MTLSDSFRAYCTPVPVWGVAPSWIYCKLALAPSRSKIRSAVEGTSVEAPTASAREATRGGLLQICASDCGHRFSVDGRILLCVVVQPGNGMDQGDVD